jgi:hypothetical protein
MGLTTIVSGGQTGVDRAALDAALAAGFPCGGWTPADRMAEDGVIPQHYPVKPLPRAGYRQSSCASVVADSAWSFCSKVNATQKSPHRGMIRSIVAC